MTHLWGKKLKECDKKIDQAKNVKETARPIQLLQSLFEHLKTKKFTE